jgi:hypothetical protein
VSEIDVDTLLDLHMQLLKRQDKLIERIEIAEIKIMRLERENELHRGVLKGIQAANKNVGKRMGR